MANDGEITYVLLLVHLTDIQTIAIFLVVQLTRVRSVGTIRALGLPYSLLYSRVIPWEFPGESLGVSCSSQSEALGFRDDLVFLDGS